MSGVGNIAELRRIIFSFAEQQDLAVCARVCRIWTEDALDIVWRELTSPLALLRLVARDSLSPTMHWQPPEGHATIPAPMDWIRFRTFTVRVRKMHFPDLSSYNHYASALQNLALLKALCPEMPLLPNLEDVTVHASADIKWVPLVAMFLHSGVRRLVIQPGEGPSFFTYPDFFREVLLRAPLLESLEIETSSLLTHNRTFRQEDPEILAEYISQFPTLTRLAVPAAVLIRMQNIPSALPELRILHETDALWRKMFVNYTITHWPTRIAKIQNLAVSVTFACARQLLSVNPMSHLQILYLETDMVPAGQLDMTEFFRTLCNRCPAFEELTMVPLRVGRDAGEMDISVFEPLANCASLAVLDICAACALTFDDDGAARLATILSNLRICRLTFIPLLGPIYDSERHILPSLAALLPFASTCRRLEELSLILDATVPSAAADPPVRFSPVFRKLSVGHFAREWDDHVSTVAGYLAGLVPRYCSVTIPPRPHWGGRWEDLEEVGECEKRLTQAFELIPSLQLRIDEI
ncbi:hypothetical protein DFH09DRAFT_1131587 [Mycena vulgaris]|nr:hypothetical protein DFH09DRAFT_1131587 [Mycena vulgaris]